MTRLERFIEQWPEFFSRSVRDILKKLHMKEISRNEAMELIQRDLEGALNRVELESNKQ